MALYLLHEKSFSENIPNIPKREDLFGDFGMFPEKKKV